MSILDTYIPIGLGDIIYAKAMFDYNKNRFSQIKIAFRRDFIDVFHNGNPVYHKLLDDIGQLFFSEPPYLLAEGASDFRSIMQISTDYRIPLWKPDLKNLLCKGTPLNLPDQSYIVLTTKVRYVSRKQLNEKLPTLWKAIDTLSSKYKIVILGERVVQMTHEYNHHNKKDECIFGIYNDIIQNIQSDKIIDLTVPELGTTTSSLEQIQQDCLIMNKSKCTITLGVGGNFSMATATANKTIGYRIDQHDIFEVLYNNKKYDDAVITKNWDEFIDAIQGL